MYDLLLLSVMTYFIIIQNKKLWQSARNGNLEGVTQALQEGANFRCQFDVRSYM